MQKSLKQKNDVDAMRSNDIHSLIKDRIIVYSLSLGIHGRIKNIHFRNYAKTMKPVFVIEKKYVSQNLYYIRK